MQTAGSRALRLTGLTIALLWPCALFAQTNSLCAVVKLEIAQQATLEREAFDARLLINNSLPDQPLTDLKVQLFVKDSSGTTVDQLFFVKISSLINTNAIDGTGVVQSSSTAEVRWLIIPSSTTGGTSPAGKQYAVRARITGTSAGSPQSVTTFDAFITVFPQPALKIEYVLPYEVFADEPLTESTIEPIEPFALGVRITNAGFGTAKNFSIDSAQPKITENKQGLLIDFNLLGTVVNGVTMPNTLLIPFGDIAPSGVGQASWIMSTTLSGRFIEFSSTFTHAAELGGQLTSLIESVTTYTLIKDALVDLPGRDGTPDFLVNTSFPRQAMQALLDSGGIPPAELLLESDQPQPLPVSEIPGALSGSLNGTNTTLTLSFAQAVGANIWARASAPFSQGAGAKLASAPRRGDGKLIDPKNVWISKHFRKADLTVLYRVNVLDLTSASTFYVLNFNAQGADAPPGAVNDLAASTRPESGAIALNWTAPGEDGYSGAILGGRYLIQHDQNPLAAFNPTSAQISRATATAPGNRENLNLADLVGNATHYAVLWTQDTGGNISSASNRANAYALPYPPTGLVVDSLTSQTASLHWQPGNNLLPIVYRILASTQAGGIAVSSTPFQDTFNTTFTFTGLTPNTSYFLSGFAFNPDNNIFSPTASLGVIFTSAPTGIAVNAPSTATISAVNISSITLSWEASNPAGTPYNAQISTDNFVTVYASGLTSSTLFAFTGLFSNTTHYLRVQAVNPDLTGTAFAVALPTSTLAAMPAIADPTNISSFSITARWGPNGNSIFTRYSAQTSTSNTFFPVKDSSSTLNLFATFTGLLNNTSYFFRVAALGNNGQLTAFTVLPSTKTLPGVPGIPGTPSVSFVSLSTISWAWGAATNATSYKVFDAASTTTLLGTSASPAFTRAGLLFNTTYSIVVAGVNAGGAGPLSLPSIATFTLANLPTGTTAQQINVTSATIAWSLNGNPPRTMAEVQRSSNNLAFASVFLASSTVFTDKSLAACTTYYFRVRNKNGNGVFTAFDSTLRFTTKVSTPLPAGDFTASALPGSRIALTWDPSPSDRITHYRIYFDSGTGIINYNVPIAVLSSSVTSFTTGVLVSSPAYTFGLRASNGCGVEEKNTSLVATAPALPALAAVRAVIKSPHNGKRIKGNRVTVMAELVQGRPRDTKQILFQYKKAASSDWKDMKAEGSHPNPDKTDPYFIHWDVDKLDPGPYDLRAVATDNQGRADNNPASIRVVIVDRHDNDFDIDENDIGGGKCLKIQRLINGSFSVIETGDDGSPLVTTVVLSAGALDDEQAYVSIINNPRSMPQALSELTPVGAALEVSLSNGQHMLALGQTAALTFVYPDENDDGIVDASWIKADQLQIYVYNAASGRWMKEFNSHVDLEKHTITGNTSHFSLFQVFASVALDLSTVRVYPIPYKPNGGNADEGVPYSAGNPNSGVIFDNLTQEVTIKIYTVTGQLVQQLGSQLSSGKLQWDARNSAGKDVASGVYAAVVSSSGQKSVVKKILIVR